MDAVTASPQEREEAEAFRYVRKLRGFYVHLFMFVVASVALLAVNLFSSPRYLWSLWAIGAWGLALLMEAFNVFRPDWMLGPKWEKRQVEKRLGRPL